MKATGEVVIIGSGITGLMAGEMLHQASPESQLTFIDAGPRPEISGVNLHHGATLGQARDARQFSGTEGLSYQNPIHTELISEEASSTGPGWQTIVENQLTKRELTWRAELKERYVKDVTPTSNPYDEAYAQLNYGGMAVWQNLVENDPELGRFRLSNNGIYVAFATQAELKADLQSESAFNPYQNESPVALEELSALHDDVDAVIATRSLAKQLLRLPGESWRLKSLWRHMQHKLDMSDKVKFLWQTEIRDEQTLPMADTYIWATGNGYKIPDFLAEHGRVQGIGGWWMSLPNPGFKAPFKFSAPQPTGYINFTPDGRDLHISGGFGWVGERDYGDAQVLLQPAKLQFKEAVAGFLGYSVTQFADVELGACIRPSTPTGLPDLKTFEVGNAKHVMLSGAGKAGATQAPLLGLHAVTEIYGNTATEDLISVGGMHAPLIRNALLKAKSLT